MNFELDVQNWFYKYAEQVDISTKRNNQLAFAYYEYKGIDDKTTVKEWLLGLSTEEYPTYTTLMRIIKKVRRTRVEWKKKDNK